MLSRRGVLGGAAVVVGAAAAGSLVPGIRHRVLHQVPEPSHPVPSGPVGERISGSFRSAAMGQVVGFTVAFPGAVQRGLPLLLALHGRGRDHRAFFRDLEYGAYLSDAVRRGVPPFAIASVDGGEDTYWHPRASGVDPQRMLLEEFLPRLKAGGLRTQRFAVGGFSMGGYGALLLAERLGPARIAAVVPDSPALWRRWKDSAGGAFDGPQDFARHDVLAHTAALGAIPVRVTCGTSDPFLPGVRALLRQLPHAASELGRGLHDDGWWQHVGARQIAFAGRALALG